MAKIGDFGLSISTTGHADSHLTMQGSLLGTPAFSSPEQLRGSELNARSDMYSVGATLFYLLTGRAPFEDSNMVRLLSRVLEESPPDPRSLRSEIPKDLARAILRCLSKNASDRFKSYSELRKALQPYSSESPTPATLALRFGAYALDMMLLSVAGLLIQTAAWGTVGEVFNQSNIGTPKYAILMVALNVLLAAYFGYFEGVRGASLGKSLLRLRVVRLDGSLAGFWRAVLRVVVLNAITSAPFWILNLTLSDEWIKRSGEPFWAFLLFELNLILVAVVFCRARRANDFAGLHELVTGTRVARVEVANRRPVLALALEDSCADASVGDAGRIGPYDVIESLGSSVQGEWLLAFDTKLLRRVWVHAVAAGTPPVSAPQRNLNRPGRLRWITGRRSASENWDAYEAPAGKSLPALLDRPQQWAALRFLLHDLAEELETAQADGTRPEVLALDRVWITADGHAKLLDFPAPGSRAAGESFSDPAAFLRTCAGAALGPASEPVPLHAHSLVSGRTQKAPELGELLELLRTTVRGPAAISRRRRLGITLAVSAIPLISVPSWILFLVLMQDVKGRMPELTELTSVIEVSGEGERREQLRRYVAHHFRDRIENPQTWESWEAQVLMDSDRRRIAEEAVADYPSLDAQEIAVADLAAASILNNTVVLDHLGSSEFIAILCANWVIFAAIPSLMMALMARRGLVLMLFGAVVVNDRGEQATRFRVLWRAFVAWFPALFGLAALAYLAPPENELVAGLVVLAAVSVLLVVSHRRRDRSLQDVLAGTWLVPR